MILDEFVEMKWHGFTKRFYVNKGYVFTKIGDVFKVKIFDLHKNSTVKIHVKCDLCGKEKLIKFYGYDKNIKNNNYYSCSSNCSKI